MNRTSGMLFEVERSNGFWITVWSVVACTAVALTALFCWVWVRTAEADREFRKARAAVCADLPVDLRTGCVVAAK